ncbi:MAG: alpha/beta fold hydrolase, partial [Mycolicibacterium aromaticivorans]|nr:alpha/beta fold hydrolase [Mycolicibacterium aromaticivorans]
MTDVRPFRIAISDDVLADLRDRLKRTRWPEKECVDDWSQGIPQAYTRELADYWADEYDWRRREAALNRFDHYITEIDGLDLHFIHQRSSNPDALPLIITHGWPGSVVEFTKVIEPLTEDFHVVCPSLPGYGFSGKPTATGWGIEKIATTWDALMAKLGYQSYGAQGGDWGAAVTTQIGRNGGDRSRSAGDIGGCIAIHTNMPMAFPSGALTNPTDEEKDALAAGEFYAKWDSGYSKQQSTRPQTLGYG